MTSTGTFMRLAVRAIASRHWAARRRSARPVSSAARNTPVPAADSQLMVKRATSGLAPAAAAGGIRCTRLCRCGISQAGADSGPDNEDPKRWVLMVTADNEPLRYFFQVGAPQMAQQTIKMAQGSQA